MEDLTLTRSNIEAVMSDYVSDREYILIYWNIRSYVDVIRSELEWNIHILLASNDNILMRW